MSRSRIYDVVSPLTMCDNILACD